MFSDFCCTKTIYLGLIHKTNLKTALFYYFYFYDVADIEDLKVDSSQKESELNLAKDRILKLREKVAEGKEIFFM